MWLTRGSLFSYENLLVSEVKDVLALLSWLRGVRLFNSVMIIVLVSVYVIYHLNLFEVNAVDIEILQLTVRPSAPQINLRPALIHGLLQGVLNQIIIFHLPG